MSTARVPDSGGTLHVFPSVEQVFAFRRALRGSAEQPVALSFREFTDALCGCIAESESLADIRLVTRGVMRRDPHRATALLGRAWNSRAGDTAPGILDAIATKVQRLSSGAEIFAENEHLAALAEEYQKVRKTAKLRPNTEVFQQLLRTLAEPLVYSCFGPVDAIRFINCSARRTAQLAQAFANTTIVCSIERVEPGSRQVHYLELPNRTAEVRTMATVIVNSGRPLKDFMIAFPAMDRYVALIREIFPEFGLGFAMNPRPRLTSAPLWRFLENLHKASQTNLSLSSLRDLVKSPCCREAGICGADLGVMDRVERDIRALGVSSESIETMLTRLSAFVARMTEVTGEMDLPRRAPERAAKDYTIVDAFAARMRPLIEQLATERTPSKWAEHLEKLTGVQLSHNQPDFLRSVRQSRLALLEAMLKIQRVLPGRKISFGDYFAALRIYIHDLRVDDDMSESTGVLIGSPQSLAGLHTATLFVGGCVDGELPALFSKEPRELPNEISEQRNLLRTLIAQADECFLTSPLVDDNEELLPSFFLEELESAGQLTRTSREEFCGKDEPSSTGSLVAVAREKRSEPRPEESLSPQEEEILSRCAWNIAANAERQRTDSLGRFDGMISDPHLLGVLCNIADRRVYSVSQLDILVQCRFRYFAERILHLHEDEEQDDLLSPQLLGQIVHSVMFRFYTRWNNAGAGCITAVNRKAAEGMLHGEATQVLQEMSAGMPFVAELLGRKLFGFQTSLADSDERRCRYGGILSAFLNLEIARSGGNPHLMRPTYFEIGFGMNERDKEPKADAFSRPDPVELEMMGEKVRVRGRVDRVDTAAGAFEILDYKTGRSPNISRQREGFFTQIPVYLMAMEKILEDAGQPLTGAGGAFYSLRETDASLNGQFFREAYRGLENFTPRQKLMNEQQFEEAMRAVGENIAGGISDVRNGRFHVTLADEKIACFHCACEKICRKDLARVRRLVTEQEGANNDF